MCKNADHTICRIQKHLFVEHKRPLFPLRLLATHRVWPSVSISILAVAHWGGGDTWRCVSGGAGLPPGRPLTKNTPWFPSWELRDTNILVKGRGRNQLRGVLTSPGDIRGTTMAPGAIGMCSHGCAAAVLKAANEHPIFQLIFLCRVAPAWQESVGRRFWSVVN